MLIATTKAAAAALQCYSSVHARHATQRSSCRFRFHSSSKAPFSRSNYYAVAKKWLPPVFSRFFSCTTNAHFGLRFVLISTKITTASKQLRCFGRRWKQMLLIIPADGREIDVELDLMESVAFTRVADGDSVASAAWTDDVALIKYSFIISSSLCCATNANETRGRLPWSCMLRSSTSWRFLSASSPLRRWVLSPGRAFLMTEPDVLHGPPPWSAATRHVCQHDAERLDVLYATKTISHAFRIKRFIEISLSGSCYTYTVAQLLDFDGHFYYWSAPHSISAGDNLVVCRKFCAMTEANYINSDYILFDLS